MHGLCFHFCLSAPNFAKLLCLVLKAPSKVGFWGSGGMFVRRAPGALLLDYVPPEEPPSTPLGNALRIR